MLCPSCFDKHDFYVRLIWNLLIKKWECPDCRKHFNSYYHVTFETEEKTVKFNNKLAKGQY
jgi:transposase-like protein